MALDYREGDIAGQLAEAAPDGIDVYLDNVGGDHLDAALRVMNLRGRIAMVGAISRIQRHRTARGPSHLPLAIGKRINLRGMNVSDHFPRPGRYARRRRAALARGRLARRGRDRRRRHRERSRRVRFDDARRQHRPRCSSAFPGPDLPSPGRA